MAQDFELDEVDFITVGAIGSPGQRVFHLQAGQGGQLLTLILEKEQATALAASIDTMLAEIKEKFALGTSATKKSTFDLDLHEPIVPQFRIASMGLGYDHDHDRVMLIAEELLPEDAVQEARTARISATRAQIRALADHIRTVAAAGRPICGNCGRPIDPEGHFCPRSNGHKHEITSSA